MKNLILLFSFICFGGCSFLTPSGGNQVALNNERSNSTNTIIFGRIVDLNPHSVKGKLQVTYTLSQDKQGGVFGDGSFPNIDPETNFFWISVPNKDLKYFGISSIRFQINGIETPAILKDDLHKKPLFGLPLSGDKEPQYIYVGDIVIRSGLRKTSTPLNLQMFDIKEAYNKSNPASAKNYLEEKGFDSKKMVVRPLNLTKI